jgi:hypothetical protein
MVRQSVFVSGLVVTSALATGIAIANSSWQKDDPAQWTSEDVYQILNNSPWSKSAEVTVARGTAYGDSGSGNGGPWGEGGGAPGIGMGRGGMGGGGMGGGGMGGGMGRRGRGSSPASEQSVTIQWQSALPVRLAQAKSSGGTPDRAAMQPPNEYLIAVIGLPKSGFEPRSSGNNSDSNSDDAALADHLKVITVLAIGHQRSGPTKVELMQGRDGRTIFHFDKSEPITLASKDVEFRITSDHMEIRKKFNLKDMQYQGKLEL